MQNNEITKVKARIKALSERTVENGCTEAEAIAAAEMVGRLLTAYGLSMSEIDVREEKCITHLIKTGSKQRSTPMLTAFQGIAAFCDVRFYFKPEFAGDNGTWTYLRNGQVRRPRRVTASTDYVVFGHEPDVRLAAYLFDVIKSAIETEVRTFKKTGAYLAAANKKDATRSFQFGMAERVAQRLRTMKAEIAANLRRTQEEREKAAFEAEVEKRFSERFVKGDAEAVRREIEREILAEKAKTPLTGSALVVLKGQLVEQSYEEHSRKVGLKTTRISMNYRDHEAASRGRKAGDKVNLNRPLDGAAKPAGYIG